MEKFRRVIKAICGVIEVGDRALSRGPFKPAPENHNEICCWSSAGASRGVGGGELCSDGIGCYGQGEDGEFYEGREQAEKSQAREPSPAGEQSKDGEEEGCA
jgi:hypothetical protein